MAAFLQAKRKMTWMTQNHYLEVQFLWGLITALIALGQLRLAQNYCQELQQLVERLNIPAPLAAYPELFQAQLAYTWNQLETAKNHALRAIEQTEPLQYIDILICLQLPSS